ncbi:MAG: hypothetical protein R3Y06_12205 [Faecalibacterium sp.]
MAKRTKKQDEFGGTLSGGNWYILLDCLQALDVTEKIYTHVKDDALVTAINKIDLSNL